MSFFPGFEQRRVTVDDIAFNVRIGGNGSPLLLLHGYPQTHVTWHKVAPELARHFTVVCPDLKGYGDSDAPTPDRRFRQLLQAGHGRRDAGADDGAWGIGGSRSSATTAARASPIAWRSTIRRR